MQKWEYCELSWDYPNFDLIFRREGNVTYFRQKKIQGWQVWSLFEYRTTTQGALSDDESAMIDKIGIKGNYAANTVMDKTFGILGKFGWELIAGGANEKGVFNSYLFKRPIEE